MWMQTGNVLSEYVQFGPDYFTIFIVKSTLLGKMIINKDGKKAVSKIIVEVSCSAKPPPYHSQIKFVLSCLIFPEDKQKIHFHLIKNC